MANTTKLFNVASVFEGILEDPAKKQADKLARNIGMFQAGNAGMLGSALTRFQDNFRAQANKATTAINPNLDVRNPEERFREAVNSINPEDPNAEAKYIEATKTFMPSKLPSLMAKIREGKIADERLGRERATEERAVAEEGRRDTRLDQAQEKLDQAAARLEMDQAREGREALTAVQQEQQNELERIAGRNAATMLERSGALDGKPELEALLIPGLRSGSIAPDDAGRILNSWRMSEAQLINAGVNANKPVGSSRRNSVTDNNVERIKATIARAGNKVGEITGSTWFGVEGEKFKVGDEVVSMDADFLRDKAVTAMENTELSSEEAGENAVAFGVQMLNLRNQYVGENKSIPQATYEALLAEHFGITPVNVTASPAVPNSEDDFLDSLKQD